jgi:hypothetical protein
VPESADNQLKEAADTIKATVEAIQAIASILDDAARSVIIEVNNTTTRTLNLTKVQSLFGGFRAPLPPDSISPRTTALFAHASKGTPAVTGSDGAVGYSMNDDAGSSLVLKWDNPFIGSNDFSAPVEGPSARDFYFVRTFTGSGDKGAHMRAMLGERADFAERDRFWRTCGECKALFFEPDQARSVCPSNATGGSVVDPEGNVLMEFDTHKAAGFTFQLSHATFPGVNREVGWRRCMNCKSLFWDGFDQRKGICTARLIHAGFKGHVAEGPVLQLPFDMPLGPNQQNEWHWCEKCFGLFFLPHNEHAECAASPALVTSLLGPKEVVPHDMASEFNFDYVLDKL